MRITVFNRGGLGVFGGHYDPHTDEANLQIRGAETVALTIEYPTAPTSPSKAEKGITSTTPAVTSGTNQITATLSAIQDNGYVDITATVGGVSRTVRIRGRSVLEVDRYETD